MNPTDTRQIAFVLYPGLTPLDLIGPLQTLAPLSRIDPTFEVLVVGEHTDVVATDAVVKLAPSHTFDDAPSPFAIVVPGGGQPTLAACGDQRLIDYVATVAASRHPRPPIDPPTSPYQSANPATPEPIWPCPRTRWWRARDRGQSAGPAVPGAAVYADSGCPATPIGAISRANSSAQSQAQSVPSLGGPLPAARHQALRLITSSTLQR